MVSKPLAFVIVIVLTAWLSAARTKPAITMNLVTSFDFGMYPACGPIGHNNCILAIRFYDAESAKLLSEIPITTTLTGKKQIVSKTTVNSIPRRVYAVTVYLDTGGRMQEGVHGPVSEFSHAIQ